MNPGYQRGSLQNSVNVPSNPSEERMENKREDSKSIVEFKELEKQFHDFCLVDLQLMKSTINNHLSYLRRFRKGIDKPIETLTIQDIRRVLMKHKDDPPSTYSNMIKTLRRFFRDFLKKPDLIVSFKLPTCHPPIKKVPTKETLQKFYNNIDGRLERALFLLLASSGLRRSEALYIKLNETDLEKRMLTPHHRSRTKRSYITFYNEEAEDALKQWIEIRPVNSDKLFPMSTTTQHNLFYGAREKTGIKITPQMLREWFCSEMGRLGIQDRYVDAFCGRVPNSILARHYTDCSPQRLKEIYDKASLNVLS
ncbi:tyrosine-type recombinase/integrase [Candidatus Bathyarchaeota archaeon]|nr:tyrosine-type recombinase/integrase [Candidatus Bathyarchaeota archaeon]